MVNFKAEVTIPDNVEKSMYINELRIKNIYPAIFSDVVKVKLINAELSAAKHVIASYERLENKHGKNKLKFELHPT